MFTLCFRKAGAKDNGPPGERPQYTKGYYAAYVLDLDGNNVECVYYQPSAQLSNTFGALTVGVLGNLYSRMRHGVAAAALIPAIFVQVPSGLAAGGSLLAGISSADQITNTTTYANGTAKINGTSTVRTLFISGRPLC